jgi:signal transduction histidine kinase
VNRLFTSRLAYAGAVVWLLLTVSLAVWWLVFGLGQVRRLRDAGGLEPGSAGQFERMLLWEGVFFLLLLVTGGVLLLVAIRREAGRRATVEAFFMAFTHDLKTALASLQLQAESLREDLDEAAANPNLQRLMKDALRLQLQLENSLYYAQPHGRLHVEPVAVAALVRRAAIDWPEMTIEVAGDARVLADERALSAVVRNVLQNAVVHGGSRRVVVAVQRPPVGRVEVTFTDDGRGVPIGGIRQLASVTARPAAYRGSGVGLLISTRLVARMRGTLDVRAAARGVAVVVRLPAAD